MQIGTKQTIQVSSKLSANCSVYNLDQKMIEIYMHGHWSGLEGRSVSSRKGVMERRKRKGDFVIMNVTQCD